MQALGLELKSSPQYHYYGGRKCQLSYSSLEHIRSWFGGKILHPHTPPPSFSWTREEPYLYRVVYTWVLMDSKSIYVKSIQFKALLFLGECWGGGEWVPFAKDHEKSAKQVNWYAWYAILAILIICEIFFMGYLIANDILNEAVLWPSWHA